MIFSMMFSFCKCKIVAGICHLNRYYNYSNLMLKKHLWNQSRPCFLQLGHIKKCLTRHQLGFIPPINNKMLSVMSYWTISSIISFTLEQVKLKSYLCKLFKVQITFAVRDLKTLWFSMQTLSTCTVRQCKTTSTWQKYQYWYDNAKRQ